MLYLTVHLYGRNGVPGEFREYERKALEIFARHGGEVVAAYVPERSAANGDIPDEIQVLRIASRAAFDAFLGDPARTAMAGERELVIRRTEVFLARERVEYPGSAPGNTARLM